MMQMFNIVYCGLHVGQVPMLVINRNDCKGGHNDSFEQGMTLEYSAYSTRSWGYMIRTLS